MTSNLPSHPSGHTSPESLHHYEVNVEWTGNKGQGTANYRGYGRSHTIAAADKPVILGSSDPAFRGDRGCYNPEELLVASVSACHMLWYLHLCAEAKVIVLRYGDDPTGTLLETVEGGGRFREVVLRPKVAIAPTSDVTLAQKLHETAHHHCFIANSVNFPIRCEPICTVDLA